MEKFGKIFFLAFILIYAAACSSPEGKKKSAIEEMEKTLFSGENITLDRAKANELIKAYISFADEFPDADETPEFLFKAGDMSMNLKMPQKAIQVFDRVLKNYPDYEKAAQCLFLKGYVYENEIGDLNAAKKIYEDFIAKYPDDEFADDAAVSIQNLGKSPEELIKEFEEKSKAEGKI